MNMFFNFSQSQWSLICKMSLVIASQPKRTVMLDTMGVTVVNGGKVSHLQCTHIFKGATYMGVFWTAGFDSSLRTRKPTGKNGHNVQDKCNIGNTEERQSRALGNACVKIAGWLIAVESLSVKCTSFLPTNMKLPFYRLFSSGCSNWFVFLKLTLCGLVQTCSTGREGWDREKMKAAFR